MNQTLNIAKFKTCLACKFNGKIASNLCPRCRKRLWTPNGVRVWGVLQIALGILVAGFACLFIFILNYTHKKTDSPEKTFILFSSAVIVIGISFFECISGSWKLLTGKSNPKLMYAVTCIGALLLIVIDAFVSFRGI